MDEAWKTKELTDVLSKAKEGFDKNTFATLVDFITSQLVVAQRLVSVSAVRSLATQLARARAALELLPDPSAGEDAEAKFAEQLREKTTTPKALSDLKKAIDLAEEEVKTTAEKWNVEFTDGDLAQWPEGYACWKTCLTDAKGRKDDLESAVFINALILTLRVELLKKPQGQAQRSNLLSIFSTFKQRQELVVPPAFMDEAQSVLMAFGDSKKSCQDVLEHCQRALSSTPGEPSIADDAPSSSPKRRSWAAGVLPSKKSRGVDDKAVAQAEPAAAQGAGETEVRPSRSGIAGFFSAPVSDRLAKTIEKETVVEKDAVKEKPQGRGRGRAPAAKSKPKATGRGSRGGECVALGRVEASPFTGRGRGRVRGRGSRGGTGGSPVKKLPRTRVPKKKKIVGDEMAEELRLLEEELLEIGQEEGKEEAGAHSPSDEAD